jgi:hypothetical protein
MQVVQFGVSGAVQRSRHGGALPVPQAFLAVTCLGYHARVTYDIYFVRPQTGRTLLQTLEAANAEFDLDAEPEPLRLTPQQRAAWDRIAQRVMRELRPASCEEFLYTLSLRREGPEGAVQLDYSGTSASIHIP